MILVDKVDIVDDFDYCGFKYLIVKHRFLFWTFRLRICLGHKGHEDSIWARWHQGRAFHEMPKTEKR